MHPLTVEQTDRYRIRGCTDAALPVFLLMLVAGIG
jgi:hypothetical protein